MGILFSKCFQLDFKCTLCNEPTSPESSIADEERGKLFVFNQANDNK